MESLCLLFNNNLTMSDTTQIKDYLRVLNLNTTRVPTFKEYKKAYRELLKLHPDLGGDTPKFQEITQAAREVFDYMCVNIKPITLVKQKLQRS